MHRFFTEEHLYIDKSVHIKEQDFHHLKNTLRIKVQEEIELCDPNGQIFIAKVINHQKTYSEVQVLEKSDNATQPKINITLYASILKGEHFDTLIQKTVECGVSSIVPVITTNTIVSIKDQQGAKKLERWNRIAKTASMQSKRDFVIEVHPIIKLKEAMEKEKQTDIETLNIVCHESHKRNSIKYILSSHLEKDIKNVNIFIGPEGGFTQEEIHDMSTASIIPVHLGKRILRAETAAQNAVFYTATYLEFEDN